jgi:transcriptional regulator with XRE-family HTH domain
MSRRGKGGGNPPERELPAFAVKLKALRETAGITQEQLALRAGLHLGAIFKLEQGRREPTWATVQTLARALGVNCLAFADDEPAELPPPEKPRAGGRKKGGSR